MKKGVAFISGIVILSFLLASCAALRPTPTPTAPPAPSATPAPESAVPEGPVEVQGSFTYTNDIITVYYVEQAVALIDMYGFVTRDLEWEIPVDSQTLGFLDLDPQARTGTYWVQLPAKPDGILVDVDNDGQTDAGVQVFAVAYSPNLTGGPFSEGDDRSRGWPTYLASVKADSENKDEVFGGKLVVWAPDDGQQFPTGFGDDGLLFTPDDPVGPIPAGYAVVDLDQQPFAIVREAEPELELYEPKEAAIKDFSTQSYSEAFESLYQAMSTNWAFNGIPGKAVDWPALHDSIAPRVAEAEKGQDALAYYQALHDFVQAVPDGHVGLSGGQLGQQDFIQKTDGGYGFAIRELDDGRAIVVFVTPGGPAEAAGMQVGAEVSEFNDEPIREAISNVQPYAGPFSSEAPRRYQQARYLLRTAPGTEASVTFANPGGEAQTVTLAAVSERDSFAFTSIARGVDPNALPVEFRILDTGIGYVSLNSYYDDLELIIRLFERALITFKNNGIDNMVIDLRHNSGGAPLGLAGFLTDEEIPLGQMEYYSETTGKFEPDGIPDEILPNENQYSFDKVAVLVGQACASACESEAYGFSQVPNAIVVGMYPTAGVFAEVSRGQFVMPEGMGGQFSTGRIVLPDGSLFLEGTGVAPTVRVPVTEANVLADEDVELRAAEDAILGVGAGDLRIEGGPVLGSKAAARTALNAGTGFLEDMAAERYEAGEVSQAGETYTYTVALQRDTRLMWMNGWCSTTREVLAENFAHIDLEFAANGVPVELDKLALFEGQNGDHFCKLYYTVVYGWPKGETRLENRVTFDAPINDGESDYPAGTHTYEYVVRLP